MKISQAAQVSGMASSAIRFYEKSGVLPDPQRTDSGYRDYADADIALLRFVHRLRSLQLPLDDVREIVELRTAGEAPCGPVRAAIEREAAAIDARMRELERLRLELKELSELADQVADDWPRSCVCHVIEGTPIEEVS